MFTRKQALQLYIEGDLGNDASLLDSDLEKFTFDDIAPGVCRECGSITDSCEPEAETNFCDECDSNAVTSILVLAGVL